MNVVRLLIALSLLLEIACTNGAVNTGPTYFQPSRITVQDFRIDPAVPTPGEPARIRFRLVRAGDDGSPIYWSTYLLERPEAGGTLSSRTGGPIASGESIEIVYTAKVPTVAFLSIYPSSTAAKPNGDGSGDWLSMPINVR